ncbi:MAG: hypothetical protein WCF77_04120 [Minisyncoccia bacterium]|jgi:hypothetical protein
MRKEPPPIIQNEIADGEKGRDSDLLLDNGIEASRSEETFSELSERYEIPIEDVRYMDLNRTGIYLPESEVRVNFRARFLADVPGLDGERRKTWFALPSRTAKDSNFSVAKNGLFFGNEKIADVQKVELDTCDVSYQRGPHLLNLNSRSRGNCAGCKVCVHNYKDLYDGTVIKDKNSLTTKEQIETFFDGKERNGLDIAKLEQIAVVTGLFGSERAVIDHLKLIKEIVAPRGFDGELMYFGCEVNSREGLGEMASLGKTALVYAIDNFTKRDQILNKRKAAVTPADAKRTLMEAKDMGIETTFAYIAGIDDLGSLGEGFSDLKESISRFPVVNIYQVQTPGQIAAMHPDAKKLEYYAKARKLIEGALGDTELEPRRWENFRPLWYETFGKKQLSTTAHVG